MKKKFSFALLISIIALMFSQFGLTYAESVTPKSSCSNYGVTPCLLPGVTREDTNYLNPEEDFPSPKTHCTDYGVTPCLLCGVTREGPRTTPELVVP